MNSEENKALLRQFIEEFDQNWGKSVDYLDKWFTDDVELHSSTWDQDIPVRYHVCLRLRACGASTQLATRVRKR